MKQVASGIKPSEGINKGISYLKQYITGKSNLEIGERIKYNIISPNYDSTISVESVKHISGEKYEIVILFATGPL